MTKKQIIQLAVLTFTLYLNIFFMIAGVYEYYDAFAILTVTILLGLYIIYSQKEHKLVKYLRILLYVILGIIIYEFLRFNFSGGTSYWFYTVVLGFTPLEAFRTIVFDFYTTYFLIVGAVLLFNKPLKQKMIRIGKLKIGL